MRRHVTNCHEKVEQIRYQCPYCTKSRSRREDLIRYHIVDVHPERLIEIQTDPTLIARITEKEESQAKRRRTDGRTEDRGKLKKCETEDRREKQKVEVKTARKEQVKDRELNVRKDQQQQEIEDTRVVKKISEGLEATNMVQENYRTNMVQEKDNTNMAQEKDNAEMVQEKDDANMVQDKGAGDNRFEQLPITDDIISITRVEPVVSPLPNDSPTLFNRLDQMLAGVDRSVTKEQQELGQAVKSILPEASDVTHTMYIPNCESIATQFSPQKKNESAVQDFSAVNEATTVEDLIAPPPSFLQSVPLHQPFPTPTSSQLPSPVNSPVAFSEPAPSKTPHQYLQDMRYLETHCKHGMLRPIHVHIKRRIIEPNGRRVKSKEIQVNCALCPPPVIANIESLPGRKSERSQRSTNFSSSSSDSD